MKKCICTYPTGLPCSSNGKESVCNVEDPGSIPGSRRFLAEGNDKPLRYFCLENPMDRGAWQATVHGAAESDIPEWLSHIKMPWSPSGTPSVLGCSSPDSISVPRRQQPRQQSAAWAGPWRQRVTYLAGCRGTSTVLPVTGQHVGSLVNQNFPNDLQGLVKNGFKSCLHKTMKRA